MVPALRTERLSRVLHLALVRSKRESDVYGLDMRRVRSGGVRDEREVSV